MGDEHRWLPHIRAALISLAVATGAGLIALVSRAGAFVALLIALGVAVVGLLILEMYERGRLSSLWAWWLRVASTPAMPLLPLPPQTSQQMTMGNFYKLPEATRRAEHEADRLHELRSDAERASKLDAAIRDIKKEHKETEDDQVDAFLESRQAMKPTDPETAAPDVVAENTESAERVEASVPWEAGYEKSEDGDGMVLWIIRPDGDEGRLVHCTVESVDYRSQHRWQYRFSLMADSGVNIPDCQIQFPHGFPGGSTFLPLPRGHYRYTWVAQYGRPVILAWGDSDARIVAKGSFPW